MVLGALIVLIFAGCSDSPWAGPSPVPPDPVLIAQWARTISLGGSLFDIGGGNYIGIEIDAAGNIIGISSDDGVNWTTGDTITFFTECAAGDWATEDGYSGTYAVTGDDLTMVFFPPISTTCYYTIIP